MYLWTLSVCSDSHRILTGRCARSVGIYPSRRRWKRSKCASVRGTGAKRGSPDRSREKKVPAKGSSRKNRPCQDDCYGKNSLNIVDSGARYKVYGPTHTSDRLTGHRWLTRVTRNSPRPLSPDEALLGARADRAVARCTRPLQHRIDHGTSVVQCRGAWEEWHHAPAWPSVAIAM